MKPLTSPVPLRRFIASLKSVTSVGIVSTSAVAMLAGCAMQHKSAETLAPKADSYSAYGVRLIDEDFDNDASRNHGAWGSVYMSQQELADTNRNIVDYSLIADYKFDPNVAQWNMKFGDSNAFASNDGATLYHDSCAGCHMHEGEGAFGAGYYPPLANNTKMSSKYYIINILLTGFRGMPAFDSLMNDVQIAAVTQYVMSDLNGYSETVSTADVAQLRPDVGAEVEGR